MSTQICPTPLVILDVQDAIDQPVWNGKNNPNYVTIIQRLLAHWRQKNWPVLHVKHDEPTTTPLIIPMVHGMASRQKWHQLLAKLL